MSRNGGWESDVFETGLPFGGLAFCFFEEAVDAISSWRTRSCFFRLWLCRVIVSRVRAISLGVVPGLATIRILYPHLALRGSFPYPIVMNYIQVRHPP